MKNETPDLDQILREYHEARQLAMQDYQAGNILREALRRHWFLSVLSYAITLRDYTQVLEDKLAEATAPSPETLQKVQDAYGTDWIKQWCEDGDGSYCVLAGHHWKGDDGKCQNCGVECD